MTGSENDQPEVTSVPKAKKRRRGKKRKKPVDWSALDPMERARREQQRAKQQSYIEMRSRGIEPNPKKRRKLERKKNQQEDKQTRGGGGPKSDAESAGKGSGGRGEGKPSKEVLLSSLDKLDVEDERLQKIRREKREEKFAKEKLERRKEKKRRARDKRPSATEAGLYEEENINLPEVDIAVIPLFFSSDPVTTARVMRCAEDIKQLLEKNNISAFVDKRKRLLPGQKYKQWEIKARELKKIIGRVEIGPKEVARNTCTLVTPQGVGKVGLKREIEIGKSLVSAANAVVTGQTASQRPKTVVF